MSNTTNQTYPCVKGRDSSTFVADSGIEYYVYYISAYEASGHELEAFEFGFAPVGIADIRTVKNRTVDKKVAATIAFIIREVLNKPNRILYYTCEYTDNRHEQRNLLFYKWFDAFNDGKFGRLEYPIKRKGEPTIFFTAIYRTDNPNLGQLNGIIMDYLGDLK
ncbi:MAG: hypothetical protein EOO43_00550 [Flavobacterium sp.]|nr:MAG: hypothetical protein EOO43_00550 [Flavobacterium sp.]